MGQSTGIEWTDHTFNIAWGCWKISPGCSNCYADAFDRRLGGDHWGVNKDRKTFGEKYWSQLRKWNLAAEKEGRRRRVFCSSMTDVFLDDPIVEGELAKLWPIVRETPWLDYQMLTKRADRIASSLPADWGGGWPNVWLGVSVENQECADERIPKLLGVPAVVRFISCEPLIERVEFISYMDPNCPHCYGSGIMENESVGRDECGCVGEESLLDGIHWVIVGGESHPDRTKARPFDLAWARSIRRECSEAGVATFVKQLGSNCHGYWLDPDGEGDGICHHSPDRGWKLRDSKGGDISEFPHDLRVREMPEVVERRLEA